VGAIRSRPPCASPADAALARSDHPDQQRSA